MSPRTKRPPSCRFPVPVPCHAERLEGRVLLSTYTVTGTGDAAGSVAPAGPGGFTATTLRAALTAANARRGADLITFGRSATGLIGLNRALPHITDGLTIRGPGASRLAVTRLPGADGNFSVLYVNAGVTAAISGLTITGGKGTPRPAPAERAGGGIFNAGNLTVRNVTIRGNTAEAGGGVFNAKGGILTLRDSTLAGNFAAGEGGGLLNESGAVAAIAECALSRNFSSVSGGGVSNAGVLTVRDTRVTANSVEPNSDDVLPLGGGIYSTVGSKLTLVRSTLSGNSIPSGSGGGLASAGAAEVLDSTFLGNVASDGGGLVNIIGAMEVRGCTLSGNSTTLAGGGIEEIGGNLTVVNTTIVNNSAPYDIVDGIGGGGLALANTEPGNSARLTHVTVAGNRGGGMLVEAGVVNLFNTIVARNVTGPGSATAASDITVFPDEGGLHAEIGHASGFNLIGTGGSGGLKNGVNGNLVGVADPKLGPLADNGGPTKTIALLPGSPAINRGSNALAVGADGKPLAADQRGDGFARGVGGRVDIGAFEVQGRVLNPIFDEPDGGGISGK